MSKTTPDTTADGAPGDDHTADDEKEQVWIATGSSFGGGGSYHATEDCRYLERANNTRALPPGVKPLRSEPCSECYDLDGDD